MKIGTLGAGIAAVAMCIAGPALAVEADRVDERLNFDARQTEIGLDVRGGVQGFTGELGDQTGVGPSLGIAAVAQPWNFMGVEVGYEGSRLPISDIRVGTGEAVWRHNGTALAKVGPVINQRLQPFVGTGIGLSYLNASDGAENIYSADIQRELPVAAGVDYRVGNLRAGARATYRWLFGEDVVDVPGTFSAAEGGLFNLGVTLGGQF